MTMTLNGSGTGTVGVPNSATAQNATGTAIDFTGIPAGTKRITVMFNQVSTNGTSTPMLQLGSGSITASGYKRSVIQTGNGIATTGSTSASAAGITLAQTWVATNNLFGNLVFTNISDYSWVMSGNLGSDQTSQGFNVAGVITLSGTLDRVRLTTINGTDTFDAGSINILYE